MIWGEIQTLVPDADVVDVCSLKEYDENHDYNVVISTIVIENENDLILVHPILTDNDRMKVLQRCMKYKHKNDDEKPTGMNRYLGTIRYLGKEYGLREYPETGVIYCDDKPDSTYKFKLAVTTDDHRVNYVMLSAYKVFLDQMRYYFDRGAFRFKNLMCKEVILKALSY